MHTWSAGVHVKRAYVRDDAPHFTPAAMYLADGVRILERSGARPAGGRKAAAEDTSVKAAAIHILDIVRCSCADLIIKNRAC